MSASNQLHEQLESRSDAQLRAAQKAQQEAQLHDQFLRLDAVHKATILALSQDPTHQSYHREPLAYVELAADCAICAAFLNADRALIEFRAAVHVQRELAGGPEAARDRALEDLFREDL